MYSSVGSVYSSTFGRRPPVYRHAPPRYNKTRASWAGGPNTLRGTGEYFSGTGEYFSGVGDALPAEEQLKQPLPYLAGAVIGLGLGWLLFKK